MNYLNIAGGKIIPSEMQDNSGSTFSIMLDTMYEVYEKSINSWDLLERYKHNEMGLYFSGECVYDFLDDNLIPFDKIYCHRFLEHVPFDKVSFFIYQVSTNLKMGGEFDIIVPDYTVLAERLLNESVGAEGWDAENIILTTEIVNEPGCPHASLWTEERLKYLLELEGRFAIKDLEKNYLYDGRDIYIRAIFKRI